MLARSMGARGLERVVRDFDFGNYSEALENLFGRMTEARRHECAA